MPAVIPSRLRQTMPSGAGEAPPPGFLDTMGAGFRTTKDDIAKVQNDRLEEAYLPLIKTLTSVNGREAGYYRPWSNKAGFAINPFGQTMDLWDLDGIWSDIAKARKANPSAFSGVPESREEFEKQVTTRGGARDKDLRTVARGNGVASFVGGVGSMVFDPVNVATMPIGGAAKTLGQAVLRGAVINSVIETAQQVPLADSRKRMGEELTAKEVLLNVGMAGVFGGIIDGAGFKVGQNWDSIKAVPKDVQEALWAKAISASPALQKKLGGKVDWDALDDHLPDVVEGLIGKDNLSTDVKLSVTMMRRQNEIEAANPFRPTGAGVERHAAAFEAHLKQVAEDIVAMKRPRALVQAASDGPASISGGAPIMGGTVTVPGKPGQIGFAQDIYQGLKARGAPDHVARGVAAGIHAESASNHRIFGGYKGRALGLGQWLGERRAEIIRRYGNNPTRQQQLDFLWEELQGRDPGGRKVLAQGDEASVLRSYITDFMRPAAGPQTTGDLKRGMAALGRGGETMTLPGEAPRADGAPVDAPEIDPEAAVSAELAARGASIEAERAALADIEIDEAPVLRRELFPDEQSWRVAQATVEAEHYGLAEPGLTRQSVWEDARAVLESSKGGEVPGALYHPDIGPIDVKWGDGKGGYAHIVEKHPEVLDALPEIIDAMEVRSRSENRIQLESEDHKAAVRLDWDGQKQTWLLTAFRKEDAPAQRRTDVPGDDAQDGSPTREAGDAVAANAPKGNVPRETPQALLDAYWRESRDPDPVFGHRGDDGKLLGWSRSRKEIDGRVARDGGSVERIDPPEDIDGAVTMPVLDERYADPAGPEMKLQAERLTHDLKLEAESDAALYRLDDVEAKAIGDLLDAWDAEDVAIAAIRGCL